MEMDYQSEKFQSGTEVWLGKNCLLGQWKFPIATGTVFGQDRGEYAVWTGKKQKQIFIEVLILRVECIPVQMFLVIVWTIPSADREETV